MVSSLCSSSLKVNLPVPKSQGNPSLLYHRRKVTFFVHQSPVCSKSSKPKPVYDSPDEFFALSVDLQPRKLITDVAKPRSWFGPNGQYIRELPCPSCRSRGYTPCAKCGIERPRADCSLCNGKGTVSCSQCLGDCVVWEEFYDEQPWEKARSISPVKVKEDDEVDNLDIKAEVRRKSSRVYHSLPPEVNLKISRSLKSLNARTGLFSKRMTMIHRDPLLRAQRAAAIKKAKGTPAARRQTSEAMKKFFLDPENRRKRSLSMKGVKFYCKNCGREGHRQNYCPEVQHDQRKKQFNCRFCGEKGHNRRTCKSNGVEQTEGASRNYRCRLCGHPGHNSRTCPSARTVHANKSSPPIGKKTTYKCSICSMKGHNIRTCPLQKGT